MARTSIVCGAGALAVALALAGPGHGADDALAPHQVFARDLFKRLIETNTTHSSGDTTLAARLVEKELRAAGFPAKDVQVLEEVPKRGNLIARLRGRDASRKPM